MAKIMAKMAIMAKIGVALNKVSWWLAPRPIDTKIRRRVANKNCGRLHDALHRLIKNIDVGIMSEI